MRTKVQSSNATSKATLTGKYKANLYSGCKYPLKVVDYIDGKICIRYECQSRKYWCKETSNDNIENCLGYIVWLWEI